MSLQVIIGCMFSGKSTELIRRIRRFQSIGKRVRVINHHIDDRYGDSGIETHYGDNIKAVKLSKLKNFIERYKSMEYSVDVVCIDEAQFFTDLFECVLILVEEYNLQVVIAGLSGDFKRETFGDIYRLIPIADDIQLCKAYCKECSDGTLAVFTKRISGDGDQVDIGAADKYKAVCRKCYSSKR